jgi:hypothetical protein
MRRKGEGNEIIRTQKLYKGYEEALLDNCIDVVSFLVRDDIEILKLTKENVRLAAINNRRLAMIKELEDVIASNDGMGGNFIIAWKAAVTALRECEQEVAK